MAVQQLAKKQATKEKKKQKDLDDEFARDEEKALEDTQRMIDSMERIYKKGPKPDKSKGKKIEKRPKIKGPILEAKDGGSVEGKRLTRTVPPKKGPNSQGMRGTGSAIRGTKFKGVF